MLASLRNVSLRQPPPSCVAVSSSRRISTSFVCRADGKRAGARDADPSYERWLESEGKKYETPFRPRNWLGGQVPFPLNPTFKPPTPISHKLRQTIFNEYMTDPIKFSVRTLSERYGLSMQRVDAILRLQGLEEHWRKKKQLQTGFLDGMEEILGVVDQQKSKADRHVSMQGAAELGEDTSMADAQMDGERSNRARERYQRLFWEPIAEGQDPAVLGALQRARHDELEKHRQVAEAKAAKANVPPIIHNERVVERLGRPTLRFVDVGGLYVDVNDRIRRIKESERRSRLRARRRERKMQAIRRVVLNQTRASSKSEATSTAA